MTPLWVLFCLFWGGINSGAVREAVNFRQGQLEQGVLTSNQLLIDEALTHGADPNGRFRMTPELLRAASTRSKRVAHYFAEETKATPLIIAAALGDTAVCNQLVSHGANRYLTSAWGWIAAQYAAKCGHPELARSLFNSDPAAAHYRIEIGIAPQRIILYKDGLAVVSGKISTGRRGYDTPPGYYLVTDKERTRKSSLYKVPMPYFLRLSFSEYGIHQGYNPGRPASHGCIRVGKEAVAKALFDKTPIGTLVTIN
jgi:hypothetical protein